MAIKRYGSTVFLRRMFFNESKTEFLGKTCRADSGRIDGIGYHFRCDIQYVIGIVFLNDSDDRIPTKYEVNRFLDFC